MPESAIAGGGVAEKKGETEIEKKQKRDKGRLDSLGMPRKSS